jgi:hypothetical protein
MNHLGGLCLSPDGRRALTATCDGTLEAWEVATGRCAQLPRVEIADLSGAAFTADGNHAVLRAGSLSTLDLVDLPTGTIERTLQASSLYDSEGRRTYALAPGTGLGVSAHVDEEGTAQATKFLSEVDRRDLTKWGWPGMWSLSVWEMSTGRVVGSIRSKEIRAARVERYEVGGSKRTVHVVPRGHHASLLTCLRMSGDGQRVVTGTEEGTLKSWASTGECVASFEGVGAVHDVAFSPDCSWFVSVHGASSKGTFIEGSLFVWAATGGALIRMIELQDTTDGAAITVTADGQRVVLANARFAASWDVSTWRRTGFRWLSTSRGNDSSSDPVALEPGGRHLLVVTNNYSGGADNLSMYELSTLLTEAKSDA